MPRNILKEKQTMTVQQLINALERTGDRGQEVRIVFTDTFNIIGVYESPWGLQLYAGKASAVSRDTNNNTGD